MAAGARGRQSGTMVVRMALDRGLIDDSQAAAVTQAALEGMVEPSTVLVTRGLISPEVARRIEAEVLDRLAPAAVGGYRISGTLGAGGMGVVYKATQISVDRVVALKVLDERMACQPEFADRFLREAKTAAMINSPHVVTVHDAGRDGEYLYLAMEIVTGGDVSGLMGASGGRLQPRRAAEIVHHAALGLQAIFAAGLIHRDIKPSNIFLTDDGKAKLADLGLSRQISGDDRVTIAGEILGTPAFMSPEQAEGRELDIRSDIYSLGAALYSMLTGRNPYAASTPMATAAMVITEPFPDPLSLRPTLPMALVRIIHRCTERRPEDRFQSPQELADQMERVLDHPAVSNEDATGVTYYLRTGLRAITPGRRGFRWPTLVAAASLAALAVSALLVWGLVRPPAAAAGSPAAARQKAELTARLNAVGGEQESAHRQAEAAQDKDREFAAAAAHPANGSLADYARTRRDLWERYLNGLQGDPALVALDSGLKTARALAQSNPRQALSALDAADKACGDWTARSSAARVGSYERQLFSWCLDRGRDRDYAPLAQARIDLGGFAEFAKDALQASRKDLDQLDKPVAPPEGCAEELALYRAIAGENDADALRWQRKLLAVARARAACAPPAQPREPEAADAEALASLIALVGARGDALIAPAQARIAEHQALGERLRALDAAAALPPEPNLQGLQDDLKRWVAAFTEGERARAWRARLDDDRRWYAEIRPILEAAKRGEGDVARAGEALALAGRIHAGSADELARWAQAVEVARLRRLCAVFTQAQEPSEPEVQALARLAQLLGDAADAEVAAAQAKLRSRQQLLAELAALDPERPLPPTDRLAALAQDIERWQELFGKATPRGSAWRDRLDLARRWGPSRQVLDACDRGQIDIARIADALSVARQLLGSRNLDVARWSSEVRKALPWWPAPWAQAIGSDRGGTWAEFTVAGASTRMRWIAPGSFTMGSPAGESGRGSDEESHQVMISSGYWLADSACTQGLWQAVTGENPSRSLHDPSHPVDSVSWDASIAFLASLGQRLGGAAARLPTEAEWEYACRAGSSGAIGADKLDACAWYADNSGGEPQAVKLKAANAWGLYDMLGNVDQWCADYYHDFNGSALADPRGPDSGSERVFRGSSFDSDEEFCRCARRAAMAPGRHRPNLGMRIAISGPR